MQASSMPHLLQTVLSVVVVGTYVPNCAWVSPEPLFYPLQRVPGLEKSTYPGCVKCKRGFGNLTTAETNYELLF